MSFVFPVQFAQKFQLSSICLGLYWLGVCEASWRFLTMARQNLVWLSKTHCSLVSEIRTWHFTQAWFWTALSKGNLKVLSSFRRTRCSADVCAQKFAITQLKIQGTVATSVTQLSQQRLSPLHWWEGPKACCLRPYKGMCTILQLYFSCVSTKSNVQRKLIVLLKGCLLVLIFFQPVFTYSTSTFYASRSAFSTKYTESHKNK